MNAVLHRLINYGMWALSMLSLAFLNAQTFFVSAELLRAMKKIKLTFIQLLLSIFLLIGAIGSISAHAQESLTADLTQIFSQTDEQSTKALPVALAVP